MFVLMGLLVGETYYAKTLVPRVKALKRRHFADPGIILHSYDIRRYVGPFRLLRESKQRSLAFYDDLNSLFLQSRIRLFAIAIDKRRLRERFLSPLNPYNVSLSQILSLVCAPAAVYQPRVNAITAESRGKVEDRQLQAEYQSLLASGLSNYGAGDVSNRGATVAQRLLPTRISFVRKRVGVTGLELADLAAYPVARAVQNGDWTKLPAPIIAQKLARRLILFP